MGELLDALKEAIAGVYSALTGAAKTLADLAAIISKYIWRTFRFHFDAISQYTLGFKPFKSRDDAQLGVLGQILLTILPVTVTAWGLASLITPFIYHSWHTLRAWYISAANLSLSDLPPEKQFIEQPSNLPWYHYVYGIPGALIGSGFGLMSALMIGSARVLNHSLLTSWHVFAQITNTALEKPNKEAIFGKDNRDSAIQKYILGFPGIIIGGIAGAVGFVSVGAYRSLSINVDIAQRTFRNTINLSLDKPLPGKTLEKNDPRPWYIKYIIGLPGFLVGGGLGMLSASVMTGLKCIQHSCLSYYYLSGSLLNIGLGHPIFKGMSGDPRPAELQWFGILGFVSAIATTGLLSLLYVAGKNLLIAGMLTASVVIGLIIVAPLKRASIQKHPRFTNEQEKSNTMQKFKNLYSSLGTWGKLPSGKKN